MAQVVTVMNMKGGVGKTTVALHLAGMAARYSLGGRRPQRVLAIDYDPQFNMSQAFMSAKDYFSAENNGKTTLSILLEDEKKLDPFKLHVPGNRKPPKPSDLVVPVYSSNTGGKLDLIPSTLNLMYVALGQANARLDPIEERFGEFIRLAKKEYDLIIIDCHPAGSVFTQTSLKNSDHVLIPVVPQRYAVRGIALMLEFIEGKAVGNRRPVAHILFNQVARKGISAQERQIRNEGRFKGLCLMDTLKWYKAFGEPENGHNFVWSSRKPYSTAAFRNLEAVCNEFLQRSAPLAAKGAS